MAPYAQTALVEGDCKSYSIAAASVLAKSRGSSDADLDKEYPGYGFADHKGYATPQHVQQSTHWPLPDPSPQLLAFRPVETPLELFSPELIQPTSRRSLSPSPHPRRRNTMTRLSARQHARAPFLRAVKHFHRSQQRILFVSRGALEKIGALLIRDLFSTSAPILPNHEGIEMC